MCLLSKPTGATSPLGYKHLKDLKSLCFNLIAENDSKRTHGQACRLQLTGPAHLTLVARRFALYNAKITPPGAGSNPSHRPLGGWCLGSMLLVLRRLAFPSGSCHL